MPLCCPIPVRNYYRLSGTDLLLVACFPAQALRAPRAFAWSAVPGCSFDSCAFLRNPDMSLITRKVYNGRTTEELIALLSAVSSAILAALFIAALYFGREIFVPIALAILLSFVLAPLVGLLQRARITRGFAVVSVVILAFMIIFGLGTLIANQLTQLAGDLPVYQSTMREKIKSVRGATARSGTLERAANMLQEWSRKLDKPKEHKSFRGSSDRLGSGNTAGAMTP